MKNIIFTFAIVPLISLAGASHSDASTGGQIMMCTVKSFDDKNAKLACDPTREKFSMKTPREWLDPATKVKAGTKLKLSLDQKQYASWLEMNKETK